MMCDYLILFSMKHEFRKLFFLIHDRKVILTHAELELLTDICDVTSLLHDSEMPVLQMVKVIKRE